jgi:hypothetical protein
MLVSLSNSYFIERHQLESSSTLISLIEPILNTYQFTFTLLRKVNLVGAWIPKASATAEESDNRTIPVGVRRLWRWNRNLDWLSPIQPEGAVAMPRRHATKDLKLFPAWINSFVLRCFRATNPWVNNELIQRISSVVQICYPLAPRFFYLQAVKLLIEIHTLMILGTQW